MHLMRLEILTFGHAPQKNWHKFIHSTLVVRFGIGKSSQQSREKV